MDGMIPIAGDGKFLDFRYRPRVVRASRALISSVQYTAKGKRTIHKGDWVLVDHGKIFEVYDPETFDRMFEPVAPEPAVRVTLDAGPLITELRALRHDP